MVWPGMNQVLLMPYFLSNASSRGAPARGPNSPREIQDGEIWPRAMKPEIASKSNVRQTIWRLLIERDVIRREMIEPELPTLKFSNDLSCHASPCHGSSCHALPCHAFPI